MRIYLGRLLAKRVILQLNSYEAHNSGP